eukprot:11025662-Ditylum_brightwellii.AAC.1
MDPNYHAKIDYSDFLTGNNIFKYRMMVGSLNWLVSLGCYDIHYTQNYMFSIDYNITEADFSMHKIEEYDWFALYGNTKEEEPYGMLEPKEKPVVTSGHIAIDLAVELKYNLRMLGATVKGSTVLLSYNKIMITNTYLPHSTLKKCVLANNYHQMREAVASRIASVVHCDTKYNLTDMGTMLLNGAVY